MKRTLSARRVFVLVLLALFAIFVFIASVMPVGKNSVIRDQIQDGGHVLVFAIVAVIAFGVGRYRGFAEFHNYLQAALVSIILGIGIEAIQYPLPQRNASFGDVGRDAIGIGTGLLVVAGIVSFRTATRRSWRWRIPVLIAACGLFTFGIYPVIDCLMAQRLRDRTAPVILSTEHYWWRRFISRSECDWWLESAPNDWLNDTDNRVALIQFHPSEKYPGFGIRELWPDWSHATSLSFDIYSRMPNVFELIVRVNDQDHDDDYHDRYNKSFAIVPGFQTISIPIVDIESAPRKRRMNMTHITGLYLYVLHPEYEIRVMVDNVHLE